MNWDCEQLLAEKFETIERSIYDIACEFARELTVGILEQLDECLMKNRDKKRYVSKQTRGTTIKTVYGEVEYSRRSYYDRQEGCYVYLLDEQLQMEKIGTISANLAKIIAEATVDMPFRKAAETISQTTGQVISGHGAWNVVQNIGEIVNQDEKEKLQNMENETPQGNIDSDVIFMEADGVYLKIQENKKKAKSQELKLATIYDGWSEDGTKLHNRKVIAGMEPAKIFNKKTEALIQSVFNIDAEPIRVLNGDGAAWISNTENPERTFQLDRFHIMQSIRKSIPEKKICERLIRRFNNKEYKDMLADIEMYINSIDDNTKSANIKKAKELYLYLSNNYDGLPSWQEQVETPEAPAGITYKNMGVQENHNCSLVTMRMKHRKMRWSVSGANNMAKLIYTRANGELDEIISRMDGNILLPENLSVCDILPASKIQSVVGKANKWVDTLQVKLPVLSAPVAPYTEVIREISY